jgi:hypothetical protein
VEQHQPDVDQPGPSTSGQGVPRCVYIHVKL